ncbi:PDZ domain-containing protein [Oceanobacillus halophilus]|uniref:PDZ domain-containing protein n=1 Tax=Oceanobacillus halophilus TaxID=930130 RepID=A0A495A7G8_9BACI|nr:PDZ domain-containing protein [Oceanobacillus halophilus]RKQ35564.1 PDZ domain-containing protein [Oceanobacillus halophilus]
MIEIWLIEAAKGVGRLFLNPLVYWSFILVILAGYRRIKQERLDFGFKIFDVFSEWKGTLRFAIISGIILSLVTLGAGMVFHYETLLLLSIVVILLSITMRFTMLSAVYTIGITYLLLLFMPFILENQSLLSKELFSEANFTALSILIGLLLIVEAIMIGRIHRNRTFPSLALSNRGIWIGQARLKKMTIIPFFSLIPVGSLPPMDGVWPYLTINGESYGLVLFPLIIGFDYIAKGSMPMQAAQKLAKYIALFGVILTGLAIGSIFISWLSLVVVVLAIVGKEYLNYRFRNGERLRVPYFHPENEGLKILSIIPNTPADRLDLLVGETISKVNGIRVSNVKQFYLALHNSGAYFKLDVLDDAGEVRFVQGALYEGDHHELGLVFAERPHREKMKKVN